MASKVTASIPSTSGPVATEAHEVSGGPPLSSPGSAFREAPLPFSPEIQAKNYQVVRENFLGMNLRGESNIGGICKDALEQLRSKCKNPAEWTVADMENKDIQDLLLSYRTLGVLFDNKTLIPEEKEMLNRLLDRQQEINSKTYADLQSKASIDGKQEDEIAASALTVNQSLLNKVKQALNQVNVNADIVPDNIHNQLTAELKQKEPVIAKEFVKLIGDLLKNVNARVELKIVYNRPSGFGSEQKPSESGQEITLLQAVLGLLASLKQRIDAEKQAEAKKQDTEAQKKPPEPQKKEYPLQPGETAANQPSPAAESVPNQPVVPPPKSELTPPIVAPVIPDINPSPTAGLGGPNITPKT